MLKHIETVEDYVEYQKRVGDFFAREGVNCLSQVEGEEEPFFSWEPCDVCKRPLGGDRFHCSAYHPETNNVFYYDVCPDCRYYVEYGQLDDESMLRIEEE